MKKVTKLLSYFNITYFNLTRRAACIFVSRVGAILFILITTILLVSEGTSLYIARLDCKRSTLADGLFSSLQNTFKSDDSLLTTSEIKILATYTESKIAGTPEFIYSYLFNWCYEVYDFSEDDMSDNDFFSDYVDGNAFKLYRKENISITCNTPSKNYVFDYRGNLSDIGLNVILSYAYIANFGASTEQSALSSSNIVYQPSTEYKGKLESWRRLNSTGAKLLFANIILSAVMTVSTLLYYSRRGNEMDDGNVKGIYKHAMAALSCITCVLVYAATAIFSILMNSIRSDVAEELSTYGISMHFGPAWFGLLFSNFAVATFLFLFWAGPIWLNRSVKLQEENTKDSFLDDNNSDYCNDHENPFEDETGVLSSDLKLLSSSPEEDTENPFLEGRSKENSLTELELELQPHTDYFSLNSGKENSLVKSPILMDSLLSKWPHKK